MRLIAAPNRVWVSAKGKKTASRNPGKNRRVAIRLDELFGQRSRAEGEPALPDTTHGKRRRPGGSARREPFRQFNPRPRGIDNERDLQPDARHVPERAVEGDPVRSELFAERLQALHLETDVIE